MEFRKENFNGAFKAVLDSLLESPGGYSNSKKLAYYKLIVAKFHYFIYYMILRGLDPSKTFSATEIRQLGSLYGKVIDGKFEQRLGREKVEVSLETLANILIRNDVEGLGKISDLDGAQKFDFTNFLSFFIQKNFEPDDQDFGKFVDGFTLFLIKNERAKEHLEIIQAAFNNNETRKIFHVPQDSRPFSAYTGIGESVQKQSISTNAGWADRIQWIIDTFSNWSATSSAMLSQSGVVSSGKSYQDYSPSNILLFGPPGTGKSRAAIVIASALLEGSKSDISPETLNLAKYPSDFKDRYRLNFYGTQFHPSYAYEDFFEGLRPIQINNNDKIEISYCVVPGIFKAICQIARAYLEPSDFGIDLMVQFIRDSNGGKWELSDSSTVAHYKLGDRPGVLKFNGNPVAYTGKATGLPDEELQKNIPPTSGLYPVKWFYLGQGENSNFVLFVDELNRGNPAKIFGEALSLIEESKRLGKSEKTDIVLPYSHESFSVPPNLHIICAMNSSDKSLSNLDQAFRRRFKVIYLAPAFDLITTEIFKEMSQKYFSDEILKSLTSHFVSINNALRETRVPQENYIGHSYLMDLLRNSYRDERDARKLVHGGGERKESTEEIVRRNLRETWEGVLHSQVREIVGDSRLEEFCNNFASEVSKVKENALFLAISKDISKSLFDYLDNLQPSESKFPWKSAA
ncbi:AAA family ATPase [Bdellovibrio bacteriovorus]|uniref:AAA family ATPase n=1 Tax=Bdellovibrio bacteriovorus TaxID=959 RepID=UPI0035A5BBF2